MALCCSLTSVHADGWERKIAPVLSLIPRVGSAFPLLSGKPSKKSKHFPFLCPGCPSDPCLHPVCVRATCLPGSAVHLSFIPGRPVEFQNSKLWGPSMVRSFTGPLGVGLDTLGLVPVSPKRAVAPTYRSLEFRVKRNQKPVSR